MADQGHGKRAGGQRDGKLDARHLFPAAGPEAGRPVGDDSDNDEVAEDQAGTDRAAKAEDHEQASADLGGYRNQRPEHRRPEAQRAEEASCATNRIGAARAHGDGPANLYEPVSENHAADSEAKDEKPKIIVQWSIPSRVVFNEWIFFDETSAIEPLAGAAGGPTLGADHPFATLDR